MPIESECRYLKDAEWSRKAFSGSADGGESAENHAERVAHAAASKDKGCVISTFLFEQNAFPCVKCISWFLDKSLAGATFVFACTANEDLRQGMRVRRELGQCPGKPDEDNPRCTLCLQRPALCAQEKNHGQENWGGLQFYHRSLDQHHSDRGHSRDIAQPASAQRRIRIAKTGRSGGLRWCRIQHIRRNNSLLETSETRPDRWLFRQNSGTR